MKTIMIILLTVFLFPQVPGAANYYVINAEGNIYANEKRLTTGDKITGETEIKFTSPGDKLYLLSPDKGNFLIQPKNNQGSSVSNWVTLLKNVLPESKYYKTASRSAENTSLIFNDIYDLMGFFRDKVTYVPDTRYKVNMEKVILDENNYFRFAAPAESNQTVIPGVKLFPDGFTLTGIDPSSTPGRLEMYYVQPGKNTLVGSFDLAVKSRSAIRNELSLFFNHGEKSDLNPTLIYYVQVIPYVHKAYGNTDPDMIREIIRKDLGIEPESME